LREESLRNRTAVGEPEVTAESNFSRISQVQAGMPSSHFLAGGMTHAEILREFPYLTEEDSRACLAYAAGRERKLEISNA
jgi:hypothetical protein